MLFVAHDDSLSFMHLTYVSHIMGQQIIYSSLNTGIHFLAQHLLYRDFETVKHIFTVTPAGQFGNRHIFKKKFLHRFT